MLDFFTALQEKKIKCFILHFNVHNDYGVVGLKLSSQIHDTPLETWNVGLY